MFGTGNSMGIGCGNSRKMAVPLTLVFSYLVPQKARGKILLI